MAAELWHPNRRKAFRGETFASDWDGYCGCGGTDVDVWRGGMQEDGGRSGNCGAGPGQCESGSGKRAGFDCAAAGACAGRSRGGRAVPAGRVRGRPGASAAAGLCTAGGDAAEHDLDTRLLAVLAEGILLGSGSMGCAAVYGRAVDSPILGGRRTAVSVSCRVLGAATIFITTAP